ncbi:MAG: epoxyqueuosine reductase QueH [Clostridiales bacterium]|nr:epoxyqueuosine reductase QueH [Clostridiales bacterium]
MKKLLLHSCCAPCSSGVLPQLDDYDITLLFYNPNLDCETEYQKRLDALYQLVEQYSKEYNKEYKIIAIPYNKNEFSDRVKGMEDLPEGGKRCEVCIDIRLSYTAQYAKDNGYDIFASTLSVSPHKNHELINNIGSRLSEKLDIEYLPSNFKKNNGFLLSIQNSKKYNLYRQRYCGCTPPKDEQ